MVSLTLTATALAIMTHINVNAMKHFFSLSGKCVSFFSGSMLSFAKTQ
jgi:hypothetical protein